MDKDNVFATKPGATPVDFINAVAKDEAGKVIAVQFIDGRIMNVDQAIEYCKRGGLGAYRVGRNPYSGEEYLAMKRNQNDDISDDLDALPTFEY